MFEHLETQSSGYYKITDTANYTNNTDITAYLADRLIEESESSYGGNKEKDVISSTMFALSTKQIILHLERAEKFYRTTVDVSDLIKSVQGSSLHELYLGIEPARQFTDVLGYKVSGGADRITYGADSTPLLKTDDISILNGQDNIRLRDIKTTSSFVVKDLKAELSLYNASMSLSTLKVQLPVLFKYVIQQSIYALLYKLDIGVATLDVVIMNWTQMNRSELGEMVQEVNVPVYDSEDTLEYITEVVSKIQKYRKSGFKPDCSEIETQGKVIPEYKLVKPGKTRRVNGSKIYHTRQDAINAMSDFPGTVLYESKPKTRSILCIDYCEFNNTGVCEQGTRIREQEGK